MYPPNLNGIAKDVIPIYLTKTPEPVHYITRRLNFARRNDEWYFDDDIQTLDTYIWMNFCLSLDSLDCNRFPAGYFQIEDDGLVVKFDARMVEAIQNL